MTALPDRPEAATLDNPLYYLENFRTVLLWVGARHADLLLECERQRLDAFWHLPEPSQALLVRMVMRKGERFRLGKLVYAEIGSSEAALQALVEGDWIDPDPQLSLDELFALLTRPELGLALGERIADAGLKKSLTKQALYEALSHDAPEPAPLSQWWPDSGDRVLALNDMALFERLRLMFFGNLRQGWSEFVLEQLGHQRYEQVPLSSDSRAFQQRTDVDAYLHLHQCRERLDGDEPPSAVWTDIPREANANPWLESRRGRLLYALGRMAERAGEPLLALEAWGASCHPEARLKQLRLMERRGEDANAWPLLQAALPEPRNAAEQQGLERLRKRLGKRLGHPVPPSPRARAIETIEIALPQPGHGSVELAVAEHFSDDSCELYYVENWLFNGLLALLCWPAFYTPLPGAFFHPFQGGPADLYRGDFLERRRALFDDSLKLLDSGEYRQQILDTWTRKAGISNPMLYWPLLPRELIERALDCIPPHHLRAVFERMLTDLREYRSGLPDLIQLWPDERRYRLIEVKGPGDRLQDHQRRWLGFMREQQMDVAVCHVKWSD
uniref:VRR-NUC domain-containing protein n=1 Tax=Marinobacterium nitratireducens TaxID=518897 RepID=UPI001E5ED66B|nr:VRR-NUC domain-containing protein [Marinobacterium nitratireducens]